jgi:hypothetical protein
MSYYRSEKTEVVVVVGTTNEVCNRYIYRPLAKRYDLEVQKRNERPCVKWINSSLTFSYVIYGRKSMYVILRPTEGFVSTDCESIKNTDPGEYATNYGSCSDHLIRNQWKSHIIGVVAFEGCKISAHCRYGHDT